MLIPKKTIALIIMTLTIFLSLCSIAYAYTDGNLTYVVNLKGDGITITRCNANAEGKIEIPEAYTVAGQTLNVTEIDDIAFLGCSKITSVIVPYFVETIGHNAFQDCNALNSIDLGSCLEEIGEKAFYNCDSLTSISLPNSVKYINKSAFINCDNLSNVSLGKSVYSIDPTAFEACPKLQNFNVSKSNYYFSAIDGVLYNKSGSKIVKYPIGRSGQTYIFPETIKEIGSYAFYGCTKLTNINIPATVESIGEYAFYRNTNLKNVFMQEGVKTINSSAFSSCGRLETVVLPDTLNRIEDRAFHQSYIPNIVIPNNVTYIGDYAFGYCDFTDITIPDSVTTIGSYAFFQCTNLKKALICCSKNNISPFSLTKSAQAASIGDYSFASCSKLANVVLGESLSSIGNNAFAECDVLEKIYYTGSEASWNKVSVNSGNTALANISYNYQPFVYIIYETDSSIYTPEIHTAEKNSAVTLSSLTPVKTSNLFLGWSTTENGLSAQYQPGDTISVGENSIVLYAVWNECVDISAEIDNSNFCKIKCNNIPIGSLIVVAQYYNGNMVSAYTSEYSGAATHSVPLIKPLYDEVRVFVWNNISDMYPLTHIKHL